MNTTELLTAYAVAKTEEAAALTNLDHVTKASRLAEDKVWKLGAQLDERFRNLRRERRSLRGEIDDIDNKLSLIARRMSDQGYDGDEDPRAVHLNERAELAAKLEASREEYLLLCDYVDE